MKKFQIAWLFPDTLYIHGERGNVLALENFAKKAGFEPVVTKIDFDTQSFNPMDYDVIFCPPGELVSYPVILEWMKPYKEAFEDFVEAGRVLLVTGTSIALWGEKVSRTDGTSFSGMGLIKVETIENRQVYGDDIYFACKFNDAAFEVIGNQIQMVDFVNKGESPFGNLRYGYGNTGKDREEGFLKKNAIFTNALGPVLVSNPKLTIEIIKAAAFAREVDIAAFDYDAWLEEKSFATKKEFIETKVTRLENCNMK